VPIRFGEQLTVQPLVALLASLITILPASMAQFVTDGDLLRLLGGSKADELREAEGEPLGAAVDRRRRLFVS